MAKPLIFPEEKILAPYAARSAKSRGRSHPEPEHSYRSAFQRDRERIVHSTAFRRLEYKTQVFVNQEGDLYRTRLTHTIEVSQIARSAARAMGLNEDLAEAIALVHDLGHTPFGHTGEEILDELTKDAGGFSHNRQSLRVVDLLEEKYPSFSGLNLTYEVREGIVKHKTSGNHPVPREFFPNERATLESDLVDLADEVAYNCHDIDDGLTSGILTPEQVRTLLIWKKLEGAAQRKFKNLPFARLQSHIVREMINRQVNDLVGTTLGRIERQGIKSLEDVRKAKESLMEFSFELKKENAELKKFLNENFYRHHRLVRMADKAKRIIAELFAAYTRNPDLLPTTSRSRLKKEPPKRVVADYIAGMTDRYAILEHQRLFDPAERV
jgi:dGTPase